jgi:two-component system nitrate/nitrite response regulator NarL
MRAALDLEEGLSVVGEAADTEDVIDLAVKTNPDILILDADPPGFDITIIRKVTDRVPTTKALVVAGQVDRRSVAEALEAGAVGYLIKDAPLAELVDAVRGVAEEQIVLSRPLLTDVLPRLIRRRQTQDEALRRVWQLTAREREVLSLLVRGADKEAIARELVISPQTARTHIQNILSKLGVHSRLEAAAFVVQNGIMDELVTSGGGPAGDQK